MIQKNIPVMQGGGRGHDNPPVVGVAEIDTEKKTMTIEFKGPEVDDYFALIETFYEVQVTLGMTGRVKKHFDDAPVVGVPVEHIEPS